MMVTNCDEEMRVEISQTQMEPHFPRSRTSASPKLWAIAERINQKETRTTLSTLTLEVQTAIRAAATR